MEIQKEMKLGMLCISLNVELYFWKRWLFAHYGSQILLKTLSRHKNAL